MHIQTPTLLLAAQALTVSALSTRQAGSCPPVHIFGARETTVSQGYGTAGVVVNLVLNSVAGSTAEDIVYPACGGQASCGGQSYAASALAGTAAVASAVNAFHAKCPKTKLVLVGYSQGGQIMDNAFCGGGDTNIGLSDTSTPIVASAITQIKAVVEMGSPRYRVGFTYNVGTCTAQGFAPRPSGFVCPTGNKVKSYCDAADPYCCTGSDQATHQGYGVKYGQEALAFIKAQLAAGGSCPVKTTSTKPAVTTTAAATTPANTPATTPTSVPTTTPATGGGKCANRWDQCGGSSNYLGPTCCVAPSVCKFNNQWYSQCL